MDAIQLKELMHLRVEQANDQLIQTLAKMTEALFETLQPEVLEQEGRGEEIVPIHAAERITLEEYEASLQQPLTQKEMVGRALASEEDIAAGRVHSLEEVRTLLGR